MRFTATAAVMAGVAAASWSPDMGSHGHGGWGHGAAAPPSNGTWGDSYTTEVVTAFTTYCPEATEITHGATTYTVSEATTLTMPCPGGCTVTKPVTSAAPPPMTTSATEVSPVEPSGYTSEAPPPMTTSVGPAPVYPTNNGTMTGPAPSGTGSYTSATEGSPVPEQTGNSASTLSAGAAGLLAVFGLVAAL